MMTAEQLKASVLQLAMQGKLVEQKEEEGTGDELYKEIQNEKKRLIKEGVIKKQKLLAEITEEEMPFDIPESWKWVKLGDISSYANPKEKVSPKDITPEMWSLDLEDIEKGTGKVLNRVLAKERKIQGDKVRFKKGNILYSKLRPYLLKTLIADNDGITTPELVPFNIYGIKNSDFFLWYLRSPYVDNAVNSVSYGVKMPRVGTDTMVNLLVPLPPLAEQKRIVEKIDELMPFVEQYAAASTKLNTLNASFPEMVKKSILQEAVQGKLVPQDLNDEPASLLLKKIAEEKKRLIKEGKIKKQKQLPEVTEDEIPFDIPESWEWVKLGNVIDLLSGTDFKPSEYSDISGKTVYITGASCLTDQGVISQRWTDTPRNIASKGDLLIVCKGSGYGKTVICDVDEAHIARQIMAIKDWGLLELKYVQFFLQSRMTYIKQSGQGVIPGIDRGTILNMVFPLPPLSEQKRIVSFTSNALEIVETLGNDLK